MLIFLLIFNLKSVFQFLGFLNTVSVCMCVYVCVGFLIPTSNSGIPAGYLRTLLNSDTVYLERASVPEVKGSDP